MNVIKKKKTLDHIEPNTQRPNIPLVAFRV